MAQTTGMILSAGTLYFANGTTGTLSRIGLTANGFSGSAGVLSGPAADGENWSAATLFAGPAS